MEGNRAPASGPLTAMRRRSIGLLTAAALTLTACGAPGEPTSGPPADPDAAMLQVRSEGGFAPVEFVLGRGPTYTLTAGGTLVYEGPTAAIWPGPLVPNYLTVEVSDDDMATILALVDEIGLAEMTEESDLENGQGVADATTEIVTLWDKSGVHTYSVYALGIDPEPSNPSTAAFLELLDVLGEAAAAPGAVPYEAESVQVIAGVAMAPVDAEFEDTREWPLEGEDPAGWEELPNGWTCSTFGPEILETFEDATQVTRWLHPDPMMDAPSYALLVRPLHPGESGCDFA